METSREIDVTSLDATHRRALEDVIGVPLKHNQRLRISVSELEGSPGVQRRRQSISDWTSIYAGLSEEEIGAVDRAVNSRANLTRPLP